MVQDIKCFSQEQVSLISITLLFKRLRPLTRKAGMPASQGYGTIRSVSSLNSCKLYQSDHMNISQTYMHFSIADILVPTEVLEWKFRLTSQINYKNSENTTGSIDFDIEYSDETLKFEVVMHTVSAPQMSIKADPVHSPWRGIEDKRDILEPYKSSARTITWRWSVEQMRSYDQSR